MILLMSDGGGGDSDGDDDDDNDVTTMMMMKDICERHELTRWRAALRGRPGPLCPATAQELQLF